MHVVATVRAGQPDAVTTPPNATVLLFVPHGPVLGSFRLLGRPTAGWARRRKRSFVVFRCASCRSDGTIRCRTPRRGSPVRNPATRQETVCRHSARQGARSDDHDGWGEAGRGGFRGHRRSGRRCRPLRAACAPNPLAARPRHPDGRILTLGLHLVEQVDVVRQALGHRLFGGEQRLVPEVPLGLRDGEVVVELNPFHSKGFDHRLGQPEPEVEPLPAEHRE